MTQYRRPVPEPRQVSSPFWEGVHQHQLMVQKCTACGELRHIPRAMCPACLSTETAWVPLKGNGSVYTFTIMHRAPGPGFEDELPYVVALVELAEGVKMISNIVGCEPEQVSIGMPVRVVFEDINDQISLFKFAPA